MARKKKKEPKREFNPENVIIHEQPITETLENNYMPYAMSVIVSRAIPEIDGFKPSHRKLLYTMYKMGLLRGSRTKSANVVGQTMKLNPHGDQTIYDTMVRLTRGNEALLHPYIDSKGNMGKQYSRDMQYAAPRYTEVRLDPFAAELFRGIDHDVVDFVPNYDGTMEEPSLLPASFPSVLVNANQGIAVGMASNICSFNLAEVCAATINYIKDASTDVLRVMPAPDFPGGGALIYDLDDMRKIYETGRGSFKLRARYRIDKKNSLIEIFEIPYSTTSEAIIDAIVDLVKSNKIKEINDVRDETDLKGLKITIEVKRNTDYDVLMHRLFKMTPMESSFSCNFNVLINGTPRVLGVKALIAEWLVFRRQAVRRETLYELSEKEQKLHLLRGLEKILLDIDKAIAIIRKTESEEMVVPNLCEGFGIDSIQAEYVAEIKLRHLNREYILKRTKDIEKLQAEIEDLNKILSSPKRLDQLIIDDLERIADKFGQERRTQLIENDDIEEIDETDLIDDYNLKIFLTRDGYLKKMALTSLRSAGELKTKENDSIILEQEGTNHGLLFCFTTEANCYRIPIYELEDNKPSDWGHYLPNVLELDEGEEVFFVLLHEGSESDKHTGEVLIAFADGRISRIALSEYETKQKRRKLVKAFWPKTRPVGGVYLPEGSEPIDLILMNEQRQVLLFSSDEIEQLNSRANRGQRIQRLKKGSTTELFLPASEVELEDPSYYIARTFPQPGRYLREETLSGRQLALEDL